MDDWTIGYVVWVVGRGYVEAVDTQERACLLVDDIWNALIVDTWPEAVLLQRWCLDVAGAEMVTIHPFALNLVEGV